MSSAELLDSSRARRDSTWIVLALACHQVTNHKFVCCFVRYHRYGGANSISKLTALFKYLTWKNSSKLLSAEQQWDDSRQLCALFLKIWGAAFLIYRAIACSSKCKGSWSLYVACCRSCLVFVSDVFVKDVLHDPYGESKFLLSREINYALSEVKERCF